MPKRGFSYANLNTTLDIKTINDKSIKGDFRKIEIWFEKHRGVELNWTQAKNDFSLFMENPQGWVDRYSIPSIR